MILLIDNYDSFTYNLVHLLGETDTRCTVRRNDQISVEAALALSPKAVIFSPGPCGPTEAGISLNLVQAAAARTIPMLGVCLGHQTIGQAFGAQVTRCPVIMHGKVSQITHTRHALFQDIPAQFNVTRYHSLHIPAETLPAELEKIATTVDGEIVMAIAHRHKPIYGVQFHPESIASEYGVQLIRNFLALIESAEYAV